jgi:hypothetical protein
MRHREFIAGLGGVAALPLAAGAQQPAKRRSFPFSSRPRPGKRPLP